MLWARVRCTSAVRAIARRHVHSTPSQRSEDILERLHKNFEAKKQEHVESARRDGAFILSVTGHADELERNPTHKYGLVDYSDADKTKAIYGFGYTRPEEVFVNNDLDLSNIEVYGFDYDYTLANYTENLAKAIYDILRDILVDMLRYPKAVKDLQFDPSFAIRGLHYDFNMGWLMKIDSFANIQLNTVHVGRDSISDPEQVIRHYNGTHIGPSYLNECMFQLNDLFSIPQACLLSDVLQYFKDNNISFHPRYLSDDVSQAARILHTGSAMGATHHHIGGRLHMAVVNDVPQFLEKSPKLVGFLEKLKHNGKKTFLLSNSSLPFIDKGMQYLTSSTDWRDLFDCVIVSSRKPEFYRSRRPFRRTRQPTWASVEKFERGEVYQGGNLYDFSRLTGWSGQKVLYFGDHIYSDLIDPTIQQGWRTGAIIRELAAEIETRNTLSYRHTLAWVFRIERMLIEAQNQPHVAGLGALINEWTEERKRARHELKNVFNKSFGSVFRTYNNPTFFANKIRKFADIYMSNITNLDHLPLDYRFYPERTYLPHERLVETLIDSGKIKELLH